MFKIIGEFLDDLAKGIGCLVWIIIIFIIMLFDGC